MARILLILLFISLIYPCHAAYQSFSRFSKQPGIWGLLSQEERIHAYFFESPTHALTILDEGDKNPRYGTMEKAMQTNKCIAGVNGGYFAADTQRSPIGLLKHQGKTYHKLSRGAFTVAGVLYDTGKEIKLERSSHLTTPVDNMVEAIQGGPFLIEKGKIVPGLDNKKLARRTFVATDGMGSWCIAITSPTTLQKLAIWLSKPGTLGKLKPKSVLNLDGGTSTAIWIAQPYLYKAPFKEVRNFVGIRPR